MSNRNGRSMVGGFRLRLSVLLSAGLAAGIGSASVAAQDALGDGRLKDANQRVGSNGVNPGARVDFSAANSLRSAIVTGNAPGGLSFRGSVGYAAPREFRGQLGSDDLFAFRRDSLYSGLSGEGIRGMDALQYQFALTTGSRPPAGLAGSLSVARDVSGPAVPIDPSRPAVDAQAGAASTLTRVAPTSFGDTRGVEMWKLRSSAGYVTDRSLAESFVGGYELEGGDQLGIAASPLGGVRSFSVSPQSQEQRDPTAMPADGSAAIGQPATQDTAAQASVQTPFDRVFDGVTDEYARNAGLSGAGTSLAVERVEEQNRKLQEFLESVRSDGSAPVLEGEGEPSVADEVDPLEPASAAERLIQELDALGVDRGTIDALRSAEIRVDDLVDPSRFDGRDFYASHMSEGRQLMQAGRFFDAEARFSMALSVREGDPTASIARVHAQIGAGLFLSASLNLREAFTENPMLIAAGFAPELLPSEERIRSVVERLNARVDGEGSDARSAALLLAYVGRHTGNLDLVRRGLGRLDLDGPDPLAQLLRLVWLRDADIEEALEMLGDGTGEGE